MDFIYYLSLLIFVLVALCLPAFLLFIVAALIKPKITQKVIRRQWRRKRIATVGFLGLIIVPLGLVTILAATQPESIKAEIAAQQKAELEAKTLKAQQEEEAKRPVTKTETSTEVIKYTSTEKEDSTIAKGQRVITIPGVDGEKTNTYEVVFIKGAQVSKKLVKSETTKQPVNEVIILGTYVAPTPPPNNATPAPSASSNTYYKNCTAARAAGAAPVYRGQPGYGSHLDRDNDGIGCDRG